MVLISLSLSLSLYLVSIFFLSYIYLPLEAEYVTKDFVFFNVSRFLHVSSICRSRLTPTHTLRVDVIFVEAANGAHIHRYRIHNIVTVCHEKCITYYTFSLAVMRNKVRAKPL